jgi:hypothetical protein
LQQYHQQYHPLGYTFALKNHNEALNYLIKVNPQQVKTQKRFELKNKANVVSLTLRLVV